jgi:hypothetical protein
MSSRYTNTRKIINNTDLYKQVFRDKKIKNITQYSTYNFGNLQNIDEYNLETVFHEVQPFEKLYMISQKYYGSPEYGWLICYTNKISNEMLIQDGQGLLIYLPLISVLELVNGA